MAPVLRLVGVVLVVVAIVSDKWIFHDRRLSLCQRIRSPGSGRLRWRCWADDPSVPRPPGRGVRQPRRSPGVWVDEDGGQAARTLARGLRDLGRVPAVASYPVGLAWPLGSEPPRRRSRCRARGAGDGRSRRCGVPRRDIGQVGHHAHDQARPCTGEVGSSTGVRVDFLHVARKRRRSSGGAGPARSGPRNDRRVSCVTASSAAPLAPVQRPSVLDDRGSSAGHGGMLRRCEAVSVAARPDVSRRMLVLQGGGYQVDPGRGRRSHRRGQARTRTCTSHFHLHQRPPLALAS